MKFIVYILNSLKDNKKYIGYTRDLDRRILQHKEGLVKSTRNRRPLELIYTETFDSKKEATDREKFFKSGQGRAFLINKFSKI